MQSINKLWIPTTKIVLTSDHQSYKIQTLTNYSMIMQSINKLWIPYVYLDNAFQYYDMYPCETEIDPEPPPCSLRIIIWMNGEGTSQLNDNIPRLCATYIEESNDHVGHNFHINKYDSRYHHHTKVSPANHCILPKIQYHCMILSSSRLKIDTQVRGIKVTHITNHYLVSLCGEISHVADIPRPSNIIHTNQKKGSTLTTKFSEENVMTRIIPDGEQSRLKPSIMSDIISHCLDSLCGEIDHIVNNSSPSGIINTDQSKYSTLTMKMSEESDIKNVIVDRKKSIVKPIMVSINDLHSTPVRKLTSSWCTSTPTSSTSFQLPTVNIITLFSHQQPSATISCNNPDNSFITNCDNNPITVQPTASE